jgi:hypothetical protein
VVTVRVAMMKNRVALSSHLKSEINRRILSNVILAAVITQLVSLVCANMVCQSLAVALMKK